MIQRDALRLLLPLIVCGSILTIGTVAAVWALDLSTLRAEYGRPNHVPFPADNPYSAAKVRLGKRLFEDPLLSGLDNSSCASCHPASNNWQDGVPIAIAGNGKPMTRRTPTMWNMAWGTFYHWDGRMPKLEQAMLGPMKNPGNMAQSLEDLPAELSRSTGYSMMFAEAFPESPAISPDTISRALATYVRTIVSPEAPFDRWIAGDESAISESAKRGFAVFNGKANCAACHSGWNFTDQSFQDIGLPGEDRGRGALLKMPKMDFTFKTPTLRNVVARPPYMHDGSVATLEAVIDHYNAGFVKRPTLSPNMRELNLTGAEKSDLLEFLKTLTSDRPAVPMDEELPAIRLGVVSSDADVIQVADVTSGKQRISQRGQKFDPAQVTIKAGEGVVFVNDDNRYHNVMVSGPSTSFDSGVMEPGTEVELNLAEPGAYTATCLIHPQMTLDVEVK